MMFLHGVRRLYETMFLQNASSARMWIGHYLVGCAFYLVVSITVFIEDLDRPTGTLDTKISLITGTTLGQSFFDSIDRHSLSAAALFITASIWQYNIHSTLASLRLPGARKATYLAPPSSSLSFQLFLTPHYTAEILIYLALTLQLRNWTIFSALVWVVTNLSVSAGETRVWARSKFKGNEWGQWNLIPFLY
jgi:3-oxo-5-alpha-steroid 4-dehydrogenase 3 / polyprenol reductase